MMTAVTDCRDIDGILADCVVNNSTVQIESLVVSLVRQIECRWTVAYVPRYIESLRPQAPTWSVEAQVALAFSGSTPVHLYLSVERAGHFRDPKPHF